MAFGLRYFAELRSKYKSVFWRVEISQRDYQGSAQEMIFDGNSPLSITWEQRGDEFHIPIKGSEATINIQCHQNFQYINLFTSDARKFRVSIFRNTKLYWRGYVVADFYSENFTPPPYQVSIRAVDGFSLLSNIPYKNIDVTTIEGRQTLWTLLRSCIDLLELDVDIADWMDLYSEGMNERISPLGQIYVDMEKVYAIYDEPSYRDIIELCLKPFAGQIFQSSGALHIRRAISLYNDTRPMCFYQIAGDFPTGWIVAADGRTIITSEGDPIITNTGRDKIESMWDNDINVQGESTLDIIPALKKVSVTVSNKIRGNLIKQMGIYDLSNWTNTTDMLFLQDEDILFLKGKTDAAGAIIQTKGYHVEQCTFKMILEMNLSLEIYRHTNGGVSDQLPPIENAEVNFYYGIKIVSSDKTYFLKEDGSWVNEEVFLSEKVILMAPSDSKVEINGFPISGSFILFFKQTLRGGVVGRNIYFEYVYLKNITTGIDTYESMLRK